MTTVTPDSVVRERAAAAKVASRELARLSTEVRNRALLQIAGLLESRQEPILSANELDLVTAKEIGLSEAYTERLGLSPARLEGIAADTRAVAALPDPIGEM